LEIPRSRAAELGPLELLLLLEVLLLEELLLLNELLLRNCC
jgi:hypothetical protein